MHCVLQSYQNDKKKKKCLRKGLAITYRHQTEKKKKKVKVNSQKLSYVKHF